MKKKVLEEEVIDDIDYIDSISGKLTTEGESIQEIPISKIKIKENVRKTYNEEKIMSMAKSIKQVGQLQPITVVKAENNFYEIIFGHQRYMAFVSLNKEQPNNYFKIKCIVKDKKDFNADEIKEIQIIENIQRENLSVIELKESLMYFKNKGLTHKQIADKLGKSEGYVRNTFSAVNSLKENEELNELVKCNAGVTLADIQTVKVLPFKQQVDLIKQKLKGKIKSREELRKKVWQIKDENFELSHKNHIKKKNYDVLKIKPDGTIKIKTFDYNPEKTTKEEKEKLINLLKTLLNKIQANA